MPPVADCPWRQVMGPLDQPSMLAQDLALGSHDNRFGIDPQAGRTDRK